MKKPLSLKQIIQAVESLAPPERAEAWDNTGLLIEPATPRNPGRILVTLDLTLPVLREAVEKKCGMVIAYHPPIFEPLKALVKSDPKAAVVIEALQKGVAVYSPHTALDAAEGGLADWLADMAGEGTCAPIIDRDAAPGHPWGPGRMITLKRPCSLKALAGRYQTALGLDYIRTTRPESGQKIRTVAVCPGAGASLLLQTRADAYVTGEMRHHDLLAAQAAGTSVILCEHAGSERGYLPVFAAALRRATGRAVQVSVSTKDRGPLAPTC